MFKRLVRSLVLSFLIKFNNSPSRVSKILFGIIRLEYEPNSVSRMPSISPYKYGAKAAFCISIDFDVTEESRRVPNKRGTISTVNLSEEFQIPMTWAICGNAAFDQPDEYRRVKESSVRNEIGIHTYSHLDMSLDSTTAEMVKKEIKKCFRVLQIDGAETFVFPWNRFGHFETISSLGFSTYRGKKRILRYPKKENGLWNISPLYYIDTKSSGASNLMMRYVDLASAYAAVCHIWFHPWSVVKGDDDTFARQTLAPLLEYVAAKRKDGQIWVCTLGELAKYCAAIESTSITSSEESQASTTYTVQRTSRSAVDEVELTVLLPIPGRRLVGVEIDNISVDNFRKDAGVVKVELPVSTRKKRIKLMFRD